MDCFEEMSSEGELTPSYDYRVDVAAVAASAQAVHTHSQ